MTSESPGKPGKEAIYLSLSASTASRSGGGGGGGGKARESPGKPGKEAIYLSPVQVVRSGLRARGSYPSLAA